MSHDKDSRDFDVTLILTSARGASDDVLEAHADELLEAVLAHAHDLALGPGIAVNFATRALELDFTVVAATLADAHARIAEVAQRVEGHVSFGMADTRSEAALVPAGC